MSPTLALYNMAQAWQHDGSMGAGVIMIVILGPLSGASISFVF